MQVKHLIRIAAHTAAAAAVVLSLGPLTPAAAVLPPHVPDGMATTDSCAMCHRGHTATSEVPYRTIETTETTGTSLVLATDPTAGDVSLCVACHGVGQLGSNTDVESAFARSSVHSLAPDPAPYGPSPIVCSSCHDPHGTDRAPGGDPWPRLLRSYSLESTTPVFAGEGYCATCHTVQPGERWAGLDVYLATGHYSGIPLPANGTQVRCSICHASHGSDVAPLLAASIVPTSVVTTFTVTADDRTFCLACHPNVSASWVGTDTYATSAHALSSKTVTISARWVPAGQRKVGECQVCHAPMGRPDGSGGTIPKLLDAKGRDLCDRCHFAGADAVASADTSSQARPLEGALTLAAVYAPASGSQGRVSLYGRFAEGAGRLSGPRQYAPSSGTGPSAAGDIDGDGEAELVVASATAAELTVYRTNAFTGLDPQPSVYPLPAGSRVSVMAIANVVDAVINGSRPEIVLVDEAGDLRLYDLFGSSLMPVASATVVGAGPWGVATGDVTGSALPDAVVTDSSGATVYLVSDDEANGASITPFAVGVSPVAPSIGDVWSAASGSEIVVCDSASVTSTVRVLDGDGAEFDGYLVTAAAGVPAASAIGDVLPALPVAGRAEVAVAFTDEASGSSSVVVIPQLTSGPGLDVAAAVELASGAGTHTRALLTGDVDNDGLTELVAGNGGTWAQDSSAHAPFLQVWHSDTGGATFEAVQTYVGGGTELAGAASLAIADLGPVFPSRHPLDEVSASHVSTETAPFDRHVTCADCHNSHEAVPAVTAAPAVQGLLRGAWGVPVTYSGSAPSFGAAGSAANSYEVCFKCHSSYVALGGRADVATQTAPANASLHAISQASTSTVPIGTFEGAWTASSVLYCSDCHGDDGRTGAQARGPHESASAPILVAPYLGADPADPDLLCYDCHKFTVYGTGAGDGVGGSFFQTAGGAVLLHGSHNSGAGGHGVSCSACHVSHGSTANAHLLRDDIGYAPTGANAGTCANDCHLPGVHSWGP